MTKVVGYARGISWSKYRPAVCCDQLNSIPLTICACLPSFGVSLQRLVTLVKPSSDQPHCVRPERVGSAKFSPSTRSVLPSPLTKRDPRGGLTGLCVSSHQVNRCRHRGLKDMQALRRWYFARVVNFACIKTPSLKDTARRKFYPCETSLLLRWCVAFSRCRCPMRYLGRAGAYVETIPRMVWPWWIQIPITRCNVAITSSDELCELHPAILGEACFMREPELIVGYLF